MNRFIIIFLLLFFFFFLYFLSFRKGVIFEPFLSQSVYFCSIIDFP